MKTTGLSRVAKDLIIKQIKKEIDSHESFIVVQHGGKLPASTADKLRDKLRKSGSSYMVFKNTLGQKAFEKHGLPEVAAQLTGACSVVFNGADPVAPSKVLTEFAKDNEAIKIQGGFLNGKVIGADQIKVLAALPSREVLLARVVGGIQTPVSKFVGVLSGTLRQAVTVLDAIAKKKGGA
ncbi:MAG: 50S ribosomal protein L10 [Candidatus Omnitrophica bacterium]|nr:50S ribosomal protein L10 [Candidatus Omnitrophota bacterium]